MKIDLPLKTSVIILNLEKVQASQFLKKESLFYSRNF